MRWKPIVRLLVGCSLLGVILLQIDWESIRRTADHVQWALVLAALLVFTTQAFLEAWRYRCLYAPYGLTTGESIRLFFTSLFFSNFLPGSIGADLFQVQQLNRIRPGITRPVTYVMVLRVSGLLINLLIAIIVGALILAEDAFKVPIKLDPDHTKSVVQYVGIVVVIALFVGTVLIWKRNDWLELVRWMMHKLLEMVEALSELSFTQFLIIGVAGALIVLVRASALLLITDAFGQRVCLAGTLLVSSVTTIVAMVPVSVGGLGVREVSMASMLSILGVTLSDASAIAILVLLFIWTLSAFGGVIWSRSSPTTRLR